MKKRYKILILDDDKKICELIAAFIKLGTSSIDLVFAHSTPQALFKLENEFFDLAIVDKNLPGKTGLEFIELVRRNFKYNKLKIILLSGSLSNDDVHFSIENRVEDVIVKPFKYAQFLKKLKKNLE